MSFRDFNGLGARVSSANIGIFIGYSVVYLTLWDGPAYLADRLAYVKMGGWGAMIPGGGFGWGVTKVTFGSGTPLGGAGGAPLVLVPEADDYVPEPALAHIQIAARENRRIDLPSDLLFEFDSAALASDSTASLLLIADLLNNRSRLPVTIEGHTDSMGARRYNLELSQQRAQAVKDWCIAHRVHQAADFRILPCGETQPIAPNRQPDGSDDPQGRARNRRVAIRAEWST